MTIIGFGEGMLNVTENPTEVIRRIKLCEQEDARLTMGDGGPDIHMRGWFLVNAIDGETIAIQANSVAYVAP